MSQSKEEMQRQLDELKKKGEENAKLAERKNEYLKDNFKNEQVNNAIQNMKMVKEKGFGCWY